MATSINDVVDANQLFYILQVMATGRLDSQFLFHIVCLIVGDGLFIGEYL
jgi:hypothetical protein